MPPSTGTRAKVREFASKRISDFLPRLNISFIRLYQNTGDTSASCRIKWGVRILLLSRGRPYLQKHRFTLRRASPPPENERG